MQHNVICNHTLYIVPTWRFAGQESTQSYGVPPSPYTKWQATRTVAHIVWCPTGVLYCGHCPWISTDSRRTPLFNILAQTSMSTTWTRIYGQRWETYLLNGTIVPAVCCQVERFWLLEETLGKATPSEWTWQLLRTTVTCSHFLQSNLASLYRSGNTFLFSVFIYFLYGSPFVCKTLHIIRMGCSPYLIWPACL